MQNTLWIYGIIASDGEEDSYGESVTPKQVRDAMGTFDPSKPILARCNSPGGSVFAGIAIRTLLAEWRAGCDVQIDGLGASIASYIATVGRSVAMAQDSMMMLHCAWSATIGDARDHRETSERLDQISDNLTAAYSRKSGKSRSEIKTAMEKETWLTDIGAVDFGLADGVLDDRGRLILGARSQKNPAALQRQLDRLIART